MALTGYFPRITLPPNTTDERKGEGLVFIVNGKVMAVDMFQGGEPTKRIINWLKSQNINQIDLAITTHAHGDHYGGFYDCVNAGIKIKEFRSYHIDSIRGGNAESRKDSDNLLALIRWLQERGTHVLFVDHGDVIKFGDISWHVYRNQPKSADKNDTHAWNYVNNGSLVLCSPELSGIIFGDGPDNPKDAIAYFQKKFGKTKFIVWITVSHHGNNFSYSNAVAAKEAGVIIALESCVERDGPGTTDWTEFGSARIVQQKIIVWMQDEDIFITAADGKITFRQGSNVKTISIPYETKVKTGWVKDDKGWWYRYEDGTWAVGWAYLPWSMSKRPDKKDWFFFDENGYMKTGWVKDKGWWYFLDDKDGYMHTGWLNRYGLFYLEPVSGKGEGGQGHAYMNERATIDGKTYWFDDNCYAKEISSTSNGVVIDKDKKFIDVSEFNDIDWAKAKSELNGVLVRCGLRGSLKSNSQYYKKIRKDFKFDKNVSELQRLGIPYSVYYFPTDCTDEEATESAKWLYELVKNLDIKFPIELDVENVKGSDGEQGRANNLNKKDRTRFLKIILDFFESKGYNIGIYASASWFNNKFDMSQFSENANKCTWVADWDAPVDYKGKYWLWQYGKININGCDKKVDANSVIYNMPAMINENKKETEKIKVNPIDVLISIAKAEVGYHEGANNSNKYGDELHRIQPSNMDKNAAWCDAFVDWCILQLCYAFGYGPEMARKVLCGDFDDYTYFSINLYKKAKRWTTKPGVGYQIFFGGTGHTGIVYKVTATKVYTIEGNKSDEVRYCEYYINDSRIIGYGMPRYELLGDETIYEIPNEETKKEEVILTKGDTGVKVRFLQLCLGNLTVDGVFGIRTLDRVILFQENYKLYPDGEVGPETWAAIVRILPMIQKGNQGRYVEALQTILGGLTVDGSFGDKTRSAVKKFQKENGLEVDGIVGPKTWAMIVAKLVM